VRVSLDESFAHRENLKVLKKQLEAPTDEAQRSMLLRLLAEEEAKGSSWVPKPTSHSCSYASASGIPFHQRRMHTRFAQLGAGTGRGGRHGGEHVGRLLGGGPNVAFCFWASTAAVYNP
jgi:hypothetical protein